MFLSKNYRLIVASRKFFVLKTNICPRSEANMLVLRASNFQGATIRPIVSRHNTLLSLLFTTEFPSLVRKSIRLQLNYFPDFVTKDVKANIQFEKGKQTKPLKRPSHGKHKLANSCWQTQVGVCERHKNRRQTPLQTVGVKQKRVCRLFLCCSHTPT